MPELRNGFDPSKLHLKKELTAIRKAAKVLRDPGTTSTWRSALPSSRSVEVNRCKELVSQNFAVVNNNVTKVIDNGFRFTSNGGEEKEKKVFLHNWKVQKSSRKRNAKKRVDEDCGGSVSSSGTAAEDSLSEAQNEGDSKSDSYAGDRRSPMIFRCRDAALTSFGSRSTSGATTKKKTKKIAHLRKHDYHQQRHRKQIGFIRRSSNQILEGSSSVSIRLGEQSDDTEECSQSISEDLRQSSSAASPLLSKLRHRKDFSRLSAKLLRMSTKDDASYSYSTPALSTSSYNLGGNRNRSTVDSWDDITASINDQDEDIDDHLDLQGRKGCGIPCYWSKRTTRSRGGCENCHSPSLSDTLKRKGSNILCGSYHRRLSTTKTKTASRSVQGLLPLLMNNADGIGESSIGTRCSDDENYGELDLEALSRLDRRRWSPSCRSQEGLEIVPLNGKCEEEGTPENIGSLSQKYKPVFFDDLIGQNIVVQSLVNAVLRGRVAPVYLFQGPQGTGKTATARIFAMALNCLSSNESKPCGYCKECMDFIAGKSRHIREVDGTNKKQTAGLRCILEELPMENPLAFLPYKVFVIDQCHLLSSKTWIAFLKFVEDPPLRVVFIFITTDIDSVPRAILSRCQKYLFNKIKDDDIVARLRKISVDENLDVEEEAFDLIALNAEGSLRDAETMLDQLSLLGKKITVSLVNELVGVVSDDKLLELLELAMSSDTAETVKRARELIDSGFDPMLLMSQLASLIMDIIAGTYHIVDAKSSDSFASGRSLTEAELGRLKHALKLLSEAEKQLRASSERSTWFMATLLQLGSVSLDPPMSGSSRRQISKTTNDNQTVASIGGRIYKQKPETHFASRKSTSSASLPKVAEGNSSHREELLLLANGSPSKQPQGEFTDRIGAATSYDAMIWNIMSRCIESGKWDDIWVRCIERCHSKTLRQLLCAHGKLVWVSEVDGSLIAYIAFGDGDIKSRAERFLSSITNSFEIVLRCSVEIRIILLSEADLLDTSGSKQMGDHLVVDRDRRASCSDITGGYADLASHRVPLKSGGSFSHSEGTLQDGTQNNSQCSTEDSEAISSTKERKHEIPTRRVESIIREQRLETAWLRTAEKGTPGSVSRSKPEKNQVLPQDGTYHNNGVESVNSMRYPSQHWKNELSRGVDSLQIKDGQALQKDQVSKRANHCIVSPSLLHNGNFIHENLGYESGSNSRGCGGLFCWNNSKPNRRGKARLFNNVRQGDSDPAHKSGNFVWFGECMKSKKAENRCC